MHTPARTSVRSAARLRPVARDAFTLIELLTVISIIGILAAIAFGMMGGVKKKAAISRARTELTVLAQALDAYRLAYGDFPQESKSESMLQALIGKIDPKGKAFSSQRKTLIELSKFTLSPENTDPFKNAQVTLVDPWDRPYIYYYYQIPSTTGGNPRRGFVLYSEGPDQGSVAPLANGTMPDDTKNTDNIYANQ